MELNDSSRAPGSSHPAIPRSVFPGSLGKTLAFTTRCPSPHSHQPTAPTSQRCRIADTAADNDPRAATAPVSKPAVFLVEPWTIQPVQTHRQHLLPILPIPTLPPPCLNQRCFVSVSVQQSALPISPLLAWLPPPQCPDQQSSPSSLGLSSPEIPGTLPDHVPASATPCPWRGSGGRIGATWC